MKIAYKALRSDGFNVSSSGLFEGDGGTVDNADVIIFPVPTSRDGKTVFSPLTDKIINLDIINKRKKGALVLACGYDFKTENMIDYGALDEFCYKNAALTAEGAIAQIVSKTDFSIMGSKLLITGFGRVSKILLSRLAPFGADITVSARKESDFALLQTLGIKHIETADFAKYAENFDIIINTLDLPLFENNTDVLRKVFLFDLSSRGCIDYTFAQTNGLRAYKLPGIPGKTAPISAGMIIAETVKKIIGREKHEEN